MPYFQHSFYEPEAPCICVINPDCSCFLLVTFLATLSKLSCFPSSAIMKKLFKEDTWDFWTQKCSLPIAKIVCFYFGKNFQSNVPKIKLKSNCNVDKTSQKNPKTQKLKGYLKKKKSLLPLSHYNLTKEFLVQQS